MIPRKKQKSRGVIRLREKLAMAEHDSLVFCERRTGWPRFQVETSTEGDSAISRAASLLALGCSMRGEVPDDYLIWVPAKKDFVLRVKRRAEELLRLGAHFASSIELSPREKEVLGEVLKSCVNKEIACRLKISVRTVKFHVSSLLAKFSVTNRWELIQKARGMLGGSQLQQETSPVLKPPAKVPLSAWGTKSSPLEWDPRTGARVVHFQQKIYPA